MYILQNIKIPNKNLSDVPFELYVRAEPEQLVIKGGKLFPSPESARLNFEFSTFFCAFSLTTWCGHGGLDQVGVTLKMVGVGTVSLWHKDETGKTLRLREMPFDGSQEEVSILLESLKEKKGILYVRIETDDPDYVFYGGYYWTPTAPRHDVHLTIVMPTFKRESYVTKNLALLSEEVLATKKGLIRLLIIDNGQTLGSVVPPFGVRIVPNKNFGGSGGFARGVIEALDGETTHLLFCDDDILLEPESVLRLQSLLGYVDEKTVVGGGMIFFSKMTKLCEIGARHESLVVDLCHNSLDLTQKMSLVSYDLPKDMNYFGWWFFACSRQAFEKEGFPLPFFVRSDDIEFGLRLVERGYTMISLLGLAVWHEDFDRKISPIMDYYTFRNGLITMWMHEKGVSGPQVVGIFFNRIFFRLMTYRYQRVQYILQALEDALKGPDFLQNLNPPEHHARLMGQQTEVMKKMDFSPIIREKLNQKAHPSLFVRRVQKAISILTANGHFLPPVFMLKGEGISDEGFLVEPLGAVRGENFLRHPSVLYYEQNVEQGITCRMDRKKFVSLGFRFVKLGARALLTNSRMVREWNKAHEKFTSLNFWRTYLGMK